MSSYNNWYNWEWRIGKMAPAHFFDTWHFKPTSTAWQPMSFKQAVRDALVKLQRHGLPLYLLYSGGLDSEIILKEAIEANIKITPITIRFKDQLNQHDLAYVEAFAQKFNQDILYLDIDIEAWRTDATSPYGYLSLVKQYGFVHMATPLYLWARNEINLTLQPGICINGSGDLPLAKGPDPKDISNTTWQVFVSIDSQWKRMHWTNTHYPNDAPLFFMYTPELVGSFINEPEIQICTQVPYKLSVSSSKKALYHRLWPDLPVRHKYTGFEHLKVTIDGTFNQVRQMENPITIYSQIPYEQFTELFERTSN